MHFTPPERPKTYSQSKNDVYFEGNKKNELNEMRTYFKNILSNPQMITQRKEVIKKIINYTTLGIDTSRFYPEMVIASATKDIVQKKLIFYYLSIYSHTNADFARMAINTFTKDTVSANPNIRALSIRHLSNLRFKGRQDYVMPILQKGLEDFSPIVKKSCVMGINKIITQLNQAKEQPIRNEELLNKLYEMLRDPDPHVVSCVIQSINEIEPEGIAMSKKLTAYLLNNISIFTQMQLPTILNYVELYDPKSQEQINEYLGILDKKFRSQSLSVVLAIGKIFLKYGKIQPQLMPQIQKRVKPSLLAFVNHDAPQVQYLALKTVLYLIKHYELTIYVPDVKKFFLNQDQPTYLKVIKIELMEANCDKSNFGDVMNELTQYLMNLETIKEAMEALDKIIMKFSEQQAKLVVKTINKLISTTSENEALCNYALPTIRNFLRKYPKEFPMFQNVFYELIRKAKSTTSKCAMLEIIGDFGEHIQDAIQLVAWGEDDNLQDEIKICLLRTHVKLFFKRPIQMLNLITNIFRTIMNDEQTRLPVRDYAAMLYKGLENDPQGLKEIFLSQREFKKERDTTYPQLQVNTFQTTYLKNKSEWIIDKNKYIDVMEEQVDYDINEEPEMDKQSMEQFLRSQRQLVDLTSAYQKIQPEHLDVNFQMSSEKFQECWENYQIGASITRIIQNLDVLNEEDLQKLFQIWSISVIASSEDEQSIKLFLYLKVLHKEIACMEFQINKEAQTLTLMVKSQNEELAGFVSKYIEDFLKLNEVI